MSTSVAARAAILDEPDDHVTLALRPVSFDDFTGQEITRERLEIAIQAARKRGETLDHILLSGPPGLGKTTLANIVAKAMGGPLITTSGPAMAKTADIGHLFSQLEPNSVVFVDEIHRLKPAAEEFLYPALEDGCLDLVIDKRPLRMPLAPFTLIGATTRKGNLSAPLRDRLGLDVVLELYPQKDMVAIIERSARMLNLRISEAAMKLVANRSRGTPRVANRFLRRLRDYAEVRAPGKWITEKVATAALRLEGVDEKGLDELDRRYLRTLVNVFMGGPAGLATIGAALDVDAATLEDTVEPYLMREGYIFRGVGGRRALPKATNLNLA